MQPRHAWIAAVLAMLVTALMAFKSPDADQRTAAIGPLDELSGPLRRALEPGDDFLPLPEPGPHDWLANHPEPGQSFQQYVREGFIRPDERRKVIVLQPIGAFTKGKGPRLKTLKTFASAYFSMPVRVLPQVTADGHGFTTRRNRHTGKRQILTHDILRFLKKKLPRDAFCILGITMEDLYPDPDWNFVFGMASLVERVGVFSFARYDPAFYGERRTRRHATVLLRRSCKVLAHETAHMFGLKHCIFYQCGLNGSNHLDESDSRPVHLCPVCLRKLQYNVGFDVVARYHRLAGFYRRNGLEPEAVWVAQRLKKIISTRK